MIIEKAFGKHLYNRLILFNFGHLAWISLIWFFLGMPTVVYQLICSAIAISLAELINYIEHYGLIRKKTEEGIYEPVNVKHSWNAPQRFSNYSLIKL